LLGVLTAGGNWGSSGNNESRSGLDRRERRSSIAKQTMKIPARQEETRIVRASAFIETADGNNPQLI
jgi:hypothetical protein